MARLTEKDLPPPLLELCVELRCTKLRGVLKGLEQPTLEDIAGAYARAMADGDEAAENFTQFFGWCVLHGKERQAWVDLTGITGFSPNFWMELINE